MKLRGESVKRGYVRAHPNVRAICRICGEPIGIYHDGPKCVNEWLKRQDEEAAKAKDGKS